MLDRLGDGEIGDAGLHHGDAVGEVDLADALEFCHAEEDAVAERQRASGQRGAGAARHHFDAVPVAIAQHAGDLIGGARQHHHHRKLTIGGEAIGFVRPHLPFGIDYRFRRQHGAERPYDLAAATENLRVWRWHSHRQCDLLQRVCMPV